MSREYTIGWHRGKRCLVVGTGKARRKISLGTADPAEAERIAPALYAELTRPDAPTVAYLWERYVAEMDGRAVVTTMGYTWKALKGRFGPLEGEAVMPEHCEAHVEARRAAGVKDGTIHTELGHLRMVLLWAVKRRLIKFAPHIPRPAKPMPRDRRLTREEVWRFIEAADMPHVRLFITLAVGTGARSAALLGLTWDRVDFATGLIDMRDPTITRPHKGRAIVPMNDMVQEALEEARRARTCPYVSEWASRRVGSVKKGFHSAAEKAGVLPVSPHILRHSAASHMAEAGVDMEEIAQYLGHGDVKTTRKVYARFSPSYLRGAANQLNYGRRSA